MDDFPSACMAIEERLGPGRTLCGHPTPSPFPHWQRLEVMPVQGGGERDRQTDRDRETETERDREREKEPPGV